MHILRQLTRVVVCGCLWLFVVATFLLLLFSTTINTISTPQTEQECLQHLVDTFVAPLVWRHEHGGSSRDPFNAPFHHATAFKDRLYTRDLLSLASVSNSWLKPLFTKHLQRFGAANRRRR